MKLSRQQKIYLAILALALGALLVDRLFRSRSAGGGLAAEASAYSVPLPGETIPAPALVFDKKTRGPEPNSQSPSMKLSQQLEILLPDECLDLVQARDAFSLPAAWLDELCAQNPLGQADAAARFAKSHQLKAVLIDGKMRSALVDDHLLILGQELDGFKLVAVNQSSATFAAGTRRVILKLKRDR
ncbi:MAG: hypothetical protein ACETVZ_02320 [Phycisphaerae bacterium]